MNLQKVLWKNCLCIFLILLTQRFYCITIGSNSQVSRNQPVLFTQAENSTNQILGFASLDSGFRLENFSTTCLYNGFFPISGAVRLNGGLLQLAENMQCNESIDFKTSGTIDAQFNSIIFSGATTQQLPVGSGVVGSLSFKGSVVTSGNINAIDWSFDDKYIAVGESNGNLSIIRIDGSTLTRVYGPTMIAGSVIYDVNWHPGGYYLSIGDRSATAVKVYYFNPLDNSLTLTATGATTSTDIYSVAWHPSGNYLLVGRTASPYIRLYNFTPGDPAMGLVSSVSLSYPLLYYHTAVWNGSGTRSVVGTSGSGSTGRLYLLDFPSLTQLDVRSTEAVVTTESFSQTSNYMAVGSLSTVVNESIQIWELSATGTVLIPRNLNPISGSTIRSRVNSVEFNQEGTYLITGFNTSSPIIRLYASSDYDSTLLLKHYKDISNGNISRVAWDNSGCNVAGGGTNKALMVYGSCIDSLKELVFKNAQILFSSDIEILAPIRFLGINSINAQDFNLTLSSGGRIIVGENSSLLIENAVINNISANLISCVDNTSTLSLSNVYWNQVADTSFAQGQLAIVGDTVMTGTTCFVYQSSQASTIFMPATWYFDRGMTFSCASSINKCLVFEGITATLYLYEALLYVTGQGLRLTNGTLVLEGQCSLVGAGQSTSTGIWIGDGVTNANNMRMRVLAESGMYAGAGYVVYANV